MVPFLPCERDEAKKSYFFILNALYIGWLFSQDWVKSNKQFSVEKQQLLQMNLMFTRSLYETRKWKINFFNSQWEIKLTRGFFNIHNFAAQEWVKRLESILPSIIAEKKSESVSTNKKKKDINHTNVYWNNADIFQISKLVNFYFDSQLLLLIIISYWTSVALSFAPLAKFALPPAKFALLVKFASKLISQKFHLPSLLSTLTTLLVYPVLYSR